jgi:hypothetical protein
MSTTDDSDAGLSAENDRVDPTAADPTPGDDVEQPVDQDRGIVATTAKAKTAVVVVHGMGLQKPRETVNGFIQTALKNFAGGRIYYSRPDMITGSYEARRLVAIERKAEGAVVQTQTEFFEYHWSYMMTGNKLRDLLPTSLRLLLRSPLRLPWQLWIPWGVLAALAFVLAWKIVDLTLHGRLKKFGVNDVIGAAFPDARLAAVVALVVFALIGWLTSSFVDVVRYLDTSPRSYDVRRRIRKGMVDLLTNLHADDEYTRIIVVAHSLGGYIAYDGLTTFWDQTDRKKDDPSVVFTRLADLQTAAQALVNDTPAGPGDKDRIDSRDTEPPEQHGSDPQDAEPAKDDYGPRDPNIIAFRAAQYELWKQMRSSEINWRVTDFITLGTPMYLANMLLTKNDKQFNALRKRSELAQCPPRSDSETVEGKTPKTLMYGRREGGKKIVHRLVTGSPFAVVRWSNYWFNPVLGLFGDPFGGSLAELFGAGIDNRAVTVNRFGRYVPLWAHTKYFKYPDCCGPDFVAPVIRAALALDLQTSLPEAQ